MQSYRIILSIILIAMLSSCGKKDRENSAIAEKSSITEIGSTKLSDHVASLKVVPLETNDSLLIGRTDAIKVKVSDIYVIISVKILPLKAEEGLEKSTSALLHRSINHVLTGMALCFLQNQVILYAACSMLMTVGAFLELMTLLSIRKVSIYIHG